MIVLADFLVTNGPPPVDILTWSQDHHMELARKAAESRMHGVDHNPVKV